MKAIGQLLRDAREERGITLQKVSKETKIQEKHLQALEEGDFSSFAGQVYIKGALRNYASAIGIDASEVIFIFEQSLKQETVLEGKRKNKKERPEKIEKGKKVVKEKKERFYPGERKTLSTGALVWIVLLAIIVAGSIWYGYRQSAWGDTRIPYGNDLAREENEETGLVEEEPPPEKEPPAISPPTPSIEILQQDRDKIHYLLKDVETKEIVLTFQGPCWVRIEQDGSVLEEITYTAGDSRHLADAQQTRIRLGAPPQAVLEVNGINLDDFRESSNPVDIVIEKEK